MIIGKVGSSPLAGKTALVTGGYGTLGSAVSLALAQLGVTVVATHHPEHAPRGNVSRDVTPIPCDITDSASVEQAFRKGAELGGQISIVVHTAGGFSSDGTLEKTSDDVWERMISMNLRGSFVVMREALRRLPASTYGRLILVSALSALRDGPGAGAYRVSKRAVVQLAEIAHAEKENPALSINVIAPGIIDTPQNRMDMPEVDRTSWVGPDRIAEAITFLCLPANGHISGTVLRFG